MNRYTLFIIALIVYTWPIKAQVDPDIKLNEGDIIEEKDALKVSEELTPLFDIFIKSIPVETSPWVVNFLKNKSPVEPLPQSITALAEL